jgi:hypothetical protein
MFYTVLLHLCLTSESNIAIRAGPILIPSVILHVDHQMPGLTEALSTNIAGDKQATF